MILAFTAFVLLLFSLFFASVMMSKYKMGLLSPTIISSIIWTLVALIPMIYLSSYNSWFAYLYVFLSVLLSLIGAALVKQTSTEYKTIPIISINNVKAYWLMSSICFMSLVGILAFIHSVGGINILLDVTAAARDISVSRYGDGLKMPIVSSIAVIFTWVGLVVSFYCYLLTKRGFYLYVLLFLFVISLLNTALQTTKLPLLIVIFLCLATYFAFSIQKNTEGRALKRIIIFTPTLFIALLLMFVGFSMLRYGWDEFDPILLEKFFIYFFGQTVGFSYFIDNMEYDLINFEPWLFIKAFGILISHTYKQGIYDTYVPIYGDFTTNVFTGFRPLIEAFGVIGSLVVVLLFSMLSQFIYLLLRITGGLIYLVLYIYILLAIFMMMFTSPFLFNNVTFILLPLLCCFTLIKERKV